VAVPLRARRTRRSTSSRSSCATEGRWHRPCIVGAWNSQSSSSSSRVGLMLERRPTGRRPRSDHPSPPARLIRQPGGTELHPVSAQPASRWLSRSRSGARSKPSRA
jgi:hypothetical protein